MRFHERKRKKKKTLLKSRGIGIEKDKYDYGAIIRDVLRLLLSSSSSRKAIGRFPRNPLKPFGFSAIPNRRRRFDGLAA